MGIRATLLRRDRVSGIGLSEPSSAPEDRPATGLRELGAYFLRLGTLGFGGPVALAGAMYRDLVERRRWITKDDYELSLALAQVMPGPWSGSRSRSSEARAGARR